ncbi:MAG: hypothetical protein QNK37_00075 [Acidobacteriota bacterium]|nr:hypothetical protein [Acidobacteriota bacterium]
MKKKVATMLAVAAFSTTSFAFPGNIIPLLCGAAEGVVAQATADGDLETALAWSQFYADCQAAGNL